MALACAGFEFAIEQEYRTEKKRYPVNVGTTVTKGWLSTKETPRIEMREEIVQIPIPIKMTKGETEEIANVLYGTTLQEAAIEARAHISPKYIDSQKKQAEP